MAGSLTISGGPITDTAYGGVQAQAKTIGPLVISATGNIIASQDIVLASGDNTITSPAGATIAVIILTANPNTVALTLKGVSGDTGNPLNATVTVPAIITFATPTSANTFHINAGGTGATINVSYL